MSKSRLKSLANAVGAKTARACDSCVKRRARWYCAADDAFLCQSCDGFVHSANPLARRHERVRLNSTTKDRSQLGTPPATWHHGFTRKPRTPRGGGPGKKSYPSICHDLVPEISVEDQRDNYEPEEQIICQVPVLEKFLNVPKTEFPILIENQEEKDNVESCLNGFFPTDMELEEFAADVETLLGRGLDTESYAMEELRLSQKDEMEDQEEEEKAMICDDDDHKDENETVQFEYESHKTDREEVMKNVNIKVKEEEQKNVPMLRLNYDLVISAWGGQGPPWTSGQPPKLDIDFNDWPAVSMGESHKKQYFGGFGDGGREARVSRYREKRRKRLFSKKIRYEVRRLNAEKRPRMKGRFVKRPVPFLAADHSSS